MSGDKGGSKADTLVKVVLFFFISLLSFSVGTFVGKQVSDSDHRRMALEGEYGAGRNVASTEGHGASAENEDKVSEKEVEALTEEFVNKEKAREPASEEKVHETAAAEHKTETKAEDGYKSYPRKPDAAATTPGPAIKGVAPAAEKIAEDKAPTDGALEKKEGAPTLPTVASSAVGKYTVQVGSYLDEKEAKNRASELKGKGWNAFYLPATVKGKTWYRVLVGLFNNQDSAKQFRTQFMKEANTQSAIVQKIVQ